MRQGPDEKTRQLTYEILKYLEQNPNAEDTLRGITEWWLVQEMLKVETLHVQQALDELVSRDLIRKRSGPDNQVLYQINGKNLKAVKTLLDLETL